MYILGQDTHASNHAVPNSNWYVLSTDCQWKAIEREWFGVSSSAIHDG